MDEEIPLQICYSNIAKSECGNHVHFKYFVPLRTVKCPSCQKIVQYNELGLVHLKRNIVIVIICVIIYILIVVAIYLRNNYFH